MFQRDSGGNRTESRWNKIERKSARMNADAADELRHPQNENVRV